MHVQHDSDVSSAAIHCGIREVADARLDPAAALEFVSDPGFGGIAMFVGRVRDLNHGRVVTGVSYDLYDALARNVFRQLAERIHGEFGPRVRLYVEHARGRLGVGDLAVVVAAGTPHRDEAFRACRALIEAVKHQAPIWKQEHYRDGDSVWSEGCSLCVASHADGEAAHGHDVDPPHAHAHAHAHAPAGGEVEDAHAPAAPTPEHG